LIVAAPGHPPVAEALATAGASRVEQPEQPANQALQPTTARLTSTVVTATIATPTPTPTTGPEPRALSAHDIVRDLRGPITSMVAAVGLLSPEATTDERRRQLDSLRSYGRQLSTALTDLDDFEQLLRGNVDLAEDAYDLGQLLHNCVDELSPSLADRGLQVRLDVSPTLPRWLLGDPSRVRQLLTRLLQLATQPANFGAAGRQRLGRRHPARRRDAPGRDDARRPPESRLRVLHPAGARARRRAAAAAERQQRLPAAPGAAKAPGTGLGGRPARSGHGTPHGRQRTDAARGVHGRVLLVEDSRDHQLLLGRLAVKAGAQVTTADSGELAMQLTESETFDLILLDMQLPGTDGYATVKKWRERGLTTPVIAVTADATPADVERCLAAGCNGHLAKPVQPPSSTRALAMHLQASTPN
jgi:CheY-like chemotaxis protein